MREAYDLDKANGDILWADAISKGMDNVKVAFEILDDNETVPRDHQFVRCHMIFDVKMEDFLRRACFVPASHMTSAPADMTYAIILSRETVHVALTIAALNDL